MLRRYWLPNMKNEALINIADERTGEVAPSMLNALRGVAAAIAQSGNVEELAANFLRSLSIELGAEGGSAFARRGEELVLVDALDPGHQRSLIRISDTTESAMGRVLWAKEPVLFDFTDSRESVKRSGYRGYRNDSFLGIPAEDSDGEIRVIVMLHNKKSGTFTQRDLCFARSAAVVCNAVLATVLRSDTNDHSPGPGSGIGCAPEQIDVEQVDFSFRTLFEPFPISVWELDVSELRDRLSRLQADEPAEVSRYLSQNPGFVRDAVETMQVVQTNSETARLFELMEVDGCRELLPMVFGVDRPEVLRFFTNLMVALVDRVARFESRLTARTLSGRTFEAYVVCFVPREGVQRRYVTMSVLDANSPEYRLHSREVAEQVARIESTAARRAIAFRLREQAQLLDVSSDAILVRDLANRILYWNESAERRYGWRAEEVLGKDVNELIYLPSYAHEPATAVAETVEHGVWSGEMHHTTRDGRTVISKTTLTLVRDEYGKPQSILSVSADITERKSIEAQLRQAQRLESLGSLAGGIAHDLNNVLSPMLMGINMLATGNLDKDAAATLAIMRSSAQRAASIVKQVLGFARGMDGKRGPMQLKHIIRETESMLENTLPKSMDVRVSVAADLWLVNGDATQLHQVLMNLAVNARDAMEQGGMLTIGAENVVLDSQGVHIHPDAEPGRYVLFTVTDTGIGMSAEVVTRIFDPFFTTKEFGKGTGLGLSTARTIMQAHQGFICVNSQPGRGTSFRVYLPAIDAVDLPSTNDSPAELPRGKGETILFVDDEPELSLMVARILESSCYHAITAADGTEALGIYARSAREIDLVVTDMMMPYLDGAATIRALRKMAPQVKIIAVSGVPTDISSLEESGIEADAFIAKPFTPGVLLTAIRMALDTTPETPGDPAQAVTAAVTPPPGAPASAPHDRGFRPAPGTRRSR